MGALFDFSFSRFVAPTIAKIVYILAMIAIALGYIGAVIGAFAADVVFGLLTLVILGPLGALLYLVLIRIAIESLLATIYTAQNTGELVRMQSGPQGPPPGGPGMPPGYGPPPGQGPPPGGPPQGPPPGQQGPPPGQQGPGQPGPGQPGPGQPGPPPPQGPPGSY
ncbi:protein of unknown function [Haloechinothrix alba]|uniref:DUF4282 domain-containing protein n=1 Tax=Haloechinothrix alba TaxID=664784 RepID=A0A238Z0Z1_9PSEU|nr:DUF4282 domain-containing protein [Haloechinothrix alba]SNR76591.1 protein of unknown function [Haloechinothrix alba]